MNARLLFATCLCCLGLAGCSNTCDKETSDESVPYADGTTDGQTYLTSSWSGPYLHFPPGRRYDLVHGLGVVPGTVEVWLAFEAHSGLSPSAGNQSVIHAVNERVINIENDTCADYYVLVTATKGPSDAGAGGSDGDGG